MSHLTARQERDYNRLAAETRPKLLNYAKLLARNPLDAEDLVQETLVMAFRSFVQFESNGSFFNWCVRILRNKFFDLQRYRKRRPEVTELDTNTNLFYMPDPALNAEEAMLWNALSEPMEEALDMARPKDKALMLMLAEEGTTAEVAEVIGINKRRVSQKLCCARRRIRGAFFKMGLSA